VEKKDGEIFTQSHFWIGSFCRISKKSLFGRRRSLFFPTDVVSVVDTIRIIKDLGNKIPDKSWMLYLLELFDDSREGKPIELNLICQFNDRDNFWAIFGGVNQYKFTKVIPMVGHAYRRRILMRRDRHLIEYQVTDLNDGTTEQFDFQGISNGRRLEFNSFQASNNFTGLEWWNKIGNSPFPIRYEAEVTNLMYGQYSQLQNNGGHKTTGTNVSYKPFSGFVANQDGYAPEYPVAFGDIGHDSDGCCRYSLTTGVCRLGPELLSG
jgi:hypothetical protein